MTKIKICGLKSLNDITYVNKYKPDYVGFVFAKSKRQVDDLLANKLKAELDRNIRVVGVFVNEPIEHITRLCQDHIIDIVQLHGDEDEVYITELKKYVLSPIIKAVRVQSTDQIREVQELPCEHFLFDTYVKEKYGGSGIVLDRKLIPKEVKPYFLAGGLKADNILDAIKECNPYCVDISSGVETDGVKDERKIKEIIDIVRREEIPGGN